MQFLRKFLCSFYGIIGNIGISDFRFQAGFQWLVSKISPLLWTPWLQAAGWTSQWHPWKVDWLLGPSGILSWYHTIYIIQHYGLNILNTHERLEVSWYITRNLHSPLVCKQKFRAGSWLCQENILKKTPKTNYKTVKKTVLSVVCGLKWDMPP